MSLQGGGELRRAVAERNVSAGGLTEDLTRFNADEDRSIVAVLITSRATGELGVELSFSSAAELVGTQNNTDSARASSMVASRHGEGVYASGLDFDWAEGEQVHVHAENNTGSPIRFTTVIYYREV